MKVTVYGIPTFQNYSDVFKIKWILKDHTYSFIQQTYIRYLVCAKHCVELKELHSNPCFHGSHLVGNNT